MRDAQMQLAVTDLFKAKWTADIHREWIDALLRNEPHRERAALERIRTNGDHSVVMPTDVMIFEKTGLQRKNSMQAYPLGAVVCLGDGAGNPPDQQIQLVEQGVTQ